MVPEISETDAVGEIAATYQRIKQVQGMPLVNLIWRHLASIDGALGWAWPLVEASSQRITAARGAVVAAVDSCNARHGLTDAVRDRPAGLHRPDVIDLFRAYERGNAWNFLAMTLLTSVQRGASPPEGGPSTAPADRLPAVPPMPRYDQLADPLRAAVDRLANSGPTGPSGLRPSLWVHLALWPGLLEQVTEIAAPVLASGSFRAAHAELVEQGPSLLGLPSLPPAPGVKRPIDAAIGPFRAQLIPEMLLIGRLLVGGS